MAGHGVPPTCRCTGRAEKRRPTLLACSPRAGERHLVRPTGSLAAITNSMYMGTSRRTQKLIGLVALVVWLHLVWGIYPLPPQAAGPCYRELVLGPMGEILAIVQKSEVEQWLAQFGNLE
jgi:hypothetical protein